MHPQVRIYKKPSGQEKLLFEDGTHASSSAPSLIRLEHKQIKTKRAEESNAIWEDGEQIDEWQVAWQTGENSVQN